VGNASEPGTLTAENRGVLGYDMQYDNGNNPWLGLISNRAADFLNFVANDINEDDFELDPTQDFSTSFGGMVPFYITNYRISEDNLLISPAWRHNSGSMSIARRQMSLGELNSVDIVFTTDKSQWSRCVVVETANPEQYAPIFGGIYNTLGNSENFDLRNSPSVGKEDNDGDGLPDPDGDGIGMGWFPGYAIDVE